jgi:multimeric flavodoxin WrbA
MPEGIAMNTAKVLVINGSYRDDGITDQAVAAAVEALQAGGADTEIINLREYPLEFCHNCRECTQLPGENPGSCVIHDGMRELVEKIESSSAFVLASPTNFDSVTALFKRFMERLVVYAYWPWDKPYPVFRKADAVRKKALLISSSAAPSLLGRLMFASCKQLKMAANTIGANPVGTLFTGRASQEKHMRLPLETRQRAQRLANRLLAS